MQDASEEPQGEDQAHGEADAADGDAEARRRIRNALEQGVDPLGLSRGHSALVCGPIAAAPAQYSGVKEDTAARTKHSKQQQALGCQSELDTVPGLPAPFGKKLRLLWVVSWGLGLLWGGFTCLTQEPDKHYPQPLSATNLRRRNRPWCLEQLNLSSAYLQSSTLHTSTLRGLGLNPRGIGLVGRPSRSGESYAVHFRTSVSLAGQLHGGLLPSGEHMVECMATSDQPECAGTTTSTSSSCKRSPVCCEHAQKVVRNASSRGSLRVHA
eukprot:4182389-Amphidinium_carterae.1